MRKNQRSVIATVGAGLAYVPGRNWNRIGSLGRASYKLVDAAIVCLPV
jgi:hypothetical protein